MTEENTDLRRVARSILQFAYKTRLNLGDKFAEEHEEPTAQGKRQSRLEHAIWKLVKGLKYGFGFRVHVEGYEPFWPGGRREEYTFYIDPQDGTANAARWQACGNRQIAESMTTVVAVAPNKADLKFGDFVVGGGLDLRNGQIWLAGKGLGVQTEPWNPNPLFSFLSYRQPREVIRKVQHHRHSPLLACEFYRYANWVTRLLINQNVEWADTASSFMNILRVPLGEVDCFFNNPLALSTQIGDKEVIEGQRGHELGAIAVCCQELGAYAIDTRTGKSLQESPFTFDGMTPVIVGVNQQTVEYYRSMIENNAAKLIKLNGVAMDVREVIAILNSSMGTRQWELRSLE